MNFDIKLITLIVLWGSKFDFSDGTTEQILSRQKRVLVYPPTSPTRHQLISGIGVPLTLEDESVTLGWTMKAQYYLPENANQLKPLFFNDIFAPWNQTNLYLLQWHKFPGGRKRREISVDPLTGLKVEKYEQNVNTIGNETLKNEDSAEESEYEEAFDDDFGDESDDSITQYMETPEAIPEMENKQASFRWEAYDNFARIFDTKHIGGRDCILRTICEAAESEFSQEAGILGEILHVILTPSTTNDPVYKPTDFDYIKAEQLGKSGAPCADIFRGCKKSLVDIFTKLYNPDLFHIQ